MPSLRHADFIAVAEMPRRTAASCKGSVKSWRRIVSLRTTGLLLTRVRSPALRLGKMVLLLVACSSAALEVGGEGVLVGASFILRKGAEWPVPFAPSWWNGKAAELCAPLLSCIMLCRSCCHQSCRLVRCRRLSACLQTLSVLKMCSHIRTSKMCSHVQSCTNRWLHVHFGVKKRRSAGLGFYLASWHRALRERKLLRPLRRCREKMLHYRQRKEVWGHGMLQGVLLAQAREGCHTSARSHAVCAKFARSGVVR